MNKSKEITYLEGNCLKIVVGARLGLGDTFLGNAQSVLKGIGAACPVFLIPLIEAEAVRIHNAIASMGENGVKNSNEVMMQVMTEYQESKSFLSYCEACGFEVNHKAKYCPQCGLCADCSI